MDKYTKKLANYLQLKKKKNKARSKAKTIIKTGRKPIKLKTTIKLFPIIKNTNVKGID